MAAMGVEMHARDGALLGLARRASTRDGRYHIRLVVGPDEYHEGVDDNAYTNVLARWNIGAPSRRCAWLESVDSGYAEELRERLDLDDARADAVAARSPTAWSTASTRETKLFEQFAGFYEMDDVPIERLRPRPLAADLLLGREVTLRSKVVKQADVVMLCYMLPDEIDDEVARANYDYYEPITCHGSSLSPGIHAAVAARLGDLERRRRGLQLAAAIDLADNMGNAARGLHLATMGGLWQAAVMGFAGIQRRRRGAAHRPAPAARLEGACSVPLLLPRRAPAVRPAPPRDGDEVGITIERAAGARCSSTARSASSTRAVTVCAARTAEPGRRSTR